MDTAHPIPFTIDDIGTILRDIMNALKYLHDLGLLHCDVKLENVLIKGTGDQLRAVLGDLDAMRSVVPFDRTFKPANRLGLNDDIQSIFNNEPDGTIGYMPPERLPFVNCIRIGTNM